LSRSAFLAEASKSDLCVGLAGPIEKDKKPYIRAFLVRNRAKE